MRTFLRFFHHRTPIPARTPGVVGVIRSARKFGVSRTRVAIPFGAIAMPAALRN